MELLMMKRLLAFSHGKQYAACRPVGPLYNTGCIPVWSLKIPISDWSWLKCNYFLLTKTGRICFKLMLTNRLKLWIEMTTMWLELISFFFFMNASSSADYSLQQVNPRPLFLSWPKARQVWKHLSLFIKTLWENCLRSIPDNPSQTTNLLEFPAKNGNNLSLGSLILHRSHTLLHWNIKCVRNLHFM